MRIGLLHPGDMGSTIGGCLRAAGHETRWASGGRSAASRKRAELAGLADAGTVADLVRCSDVVFSICPPDAALSVAGAVAETSFAGVYVDANAVAPATARHIAEVVGAGGAAVVDGGIVGPPPVDAGTTRLYLSGPATATVAELFAATAVEAIVVDDRVGSASALKLSYAAWTKGSQALLLAIHAVAEYEGVDGALRDEWARSQPDLDPRLRRAAQSARSKGWRWAGEMEEIARTFAAAGAPPGFHEAAAEVYRRHPRP